MKIKKYGRWFRMYNEVVDDPKIQTLGDELGFFWLNCMCMCSNNSGILPSIEQIAWKLRKPSDKVVAMVATLHEKGLLDCDGGDFVPHNWDCRQYTEPSTERVQRFRDRKKQDETLKHVSSVSQQTKRDETNETNETPRVEEKESRGEENRELRRESVVAFPPPAEALIADTVERMYARHPKKKNLVLIPDRLKAAVAMEVEPAAKLAQIEKCHAAWCETEDWLERNGNFAPKLDEWIADQGYTKWPKGRARDSPGYVDPDRDRIVGTPEYEARMKREEESAAKLRPLYELPIRPDNRT